MRKNVGVKLISVLLAVVMLISGAGMASFAERHIDRDIKVWINDFYVMSDVYPFAKNGRTYVPVRFIAEELGYKVGYEQATKKVTLSGYGKEIIMHIGSSAAFLNGKSVDLGEPVTAKDQRTFLPLRKIAELLGQTVSYDANAKVAVIGSGYESGKFYHLKYYYRSENVYITDEQYDFLTLKVLLKDGSVRSCVTEKEMFAVADDEVKVFFEDKNLRYNKESGVPANKQIFDEYYVESDSNDPFVGTWYGRVFDEKSAEYMDVYWYVVKTGEQEWNGLYYGNAGSKIREYEITKMIIKSDASKMFTKSIAEGYHYSELGRPATGSESLNLKIEKPFATVWEGERFKCQSEENFGLFHTHRYQLLGRNQDWQSYIQQEYYAEGLNKSNWKTNIFGVNKLQGGGKNWEEYIPEYNYDIHFEKY